MKIMVDGENLLLNRSPFSLVLANFLRIFLFRVVDSKNQDHRVFAIVLTQGVNHIIDYFLPQKENTKNELKKYEYACAQYLKSIRLLRKKRNRKISRQISLCRLISWL